MLRRILPSSKDAEKLIQEQCVPRVHKRVLTNPEVADKLTMRQRDLLVPRRLLSKLTFAEKLILGPRTGESGSILKRREVVNDATIVRRRLVPDLHSAASAAAYADFGNMDVECKNCPALRFVAERKVGSSEANSIFSNCFQGESLLCSTFRCSKIRCSFSEGCLGPRFETKCSASILLSITMLSAWLRCTQTG